MEPWKDPNVIPLIKGVADHLRKNKQAEAARQVDTYLKNGTFPTDASAAAMVNAFVHPGQPGQMSVGTNPGAPPPAVPPAPMGQNFGFNTPGQQGAGGTMMMQAPANGLPLPTETATGADVAAQAPSPPPPPPPVQQAPPPPPAPPQQGGPPVQNPTGLTDNSSLRGSAYLANPDAAMQALFRAMGLDPQRLGMYGELLVNTLQPLLQSRLQLAGLEGGTNRGGAPLDTLADVVGQVAGAAQRPGFFGGMQDFGRSVMGNLGGYVNNLTDIGKQQNAMTFAQSLATAGMNPIMRQAMSDQANRAQGAFQEQVTNTLGMPNMPNNYYAWLQQQAPQQYDYLNRILFGGR